MTSTTLPPQYTPPTVALSKHYLLDRMGHIIAYLLCVQMNVDTKSF